MESFTNCVTGVENLCDKVRVGHELSLRVISEERKATRQSLRVPRETALILTLGQMCACIGNQPLVYRIVSFTEVEKEIINF